MRILFVSQVVLDRPHGAPRHVLAVARELVRLGHEVVLAAPGREPPIEGVLRIRPPSILRPGLRMEAALALLVAREVRKRKPDVAYVRISPTSSLAPFALNRLEVPTVLELNGRVLDELAAAGRSAIVIEAVRASLRRVVAASRGLIAVNPRILRHAETELGAIGAILVENGADLDAAVPGDRHEARRALGLQPIGRVIAFVGTMVHEQRLDLLLEAHRNLENTTLLIAGDGPKFGIVEEAAARADRNAPIILLGAVPHEKAVDVVRAADVCVNVRVGDFGMKCFEYAAVGRRMISFREPGAERLDPLFTGLRAVHFIKTYDAAGVLGAIQAALKAEAELGPLPPEAVDSARRTIGWDHTAARISEVLESAAG